MDHVQATLRPRGLLPRPLPAWTLSRRAVCRSPGPNLGPAFAGARRRTAPTHERGRIGGGAAHDVRGAEAEVWIGPPDIARSPNCVMSERLNSPIRHRC